MEKGQSNFTAKRVHGGWIILDDKGQLPDWGSGGISRLYETQTEAEKVADDMNELKE